MAYNTKKSVHDIRNALPLRFLFKNLETKIQTTELQFHLLYFMGMERRLLP